MGRLADKNILITGGNSGIGLAAAQEFDREGARVAICGLNERTLQAAKETLGAGSLAVRADVSNLADLDTMFATIKREFGHLDGVFVNAGYSEFLSFEEVTEQSFDKVIAVNFKGAYFTIQKALPLLRQGSSVIINASVGARKGWPTTSTVSTCKAAVVHLARILSAELVDRGIRVNTLSPGPTDTAMFGRFPGEEQGDAVKDVLANQQSEQADGRSVGNREAGSLPRVGRFCVRRRGRLPDRRRGHGHFGRGRLSLVAESRGRSCSRSGKGRLAPPIPVTEIDVSALCGRAAELEIVGSAADGTTSTAGDPEVSATSKDLDQRCRNE